MRIIFSQFLSFLLRMSIMFTLVCISLIVASHIVIIVWLHCSGYSDEGLYLAAEECIVNKVGVNELKEEVEKLFSNRSRVKNHAPLFYEAPSGSCLDKVCQALPSSGKWVHATFNGRSALVLRFGCHYNYAWLIIVNPVERLSREDSTVRYLSDNIVVCFESGRIGYGCSNILPQ